MATLPGLVPKLSGLGQTFTQTEQKAVASVDTITNAITSPNGLRLPAAQVTSGLSSGITSITANTGGLSKVLSNVFGLGSASGSAGILNSAIGTAQTLAGAAQSVAGAAAALGLNVNALGGISQLLTGLGINGQGAMPSFALTPPFDFALQPSSTTCFPIDLPLTGSGARFAMYFKDYEKQSPTQTADYTTKNVVYFPIPDQLNESYNIEWSDINAGAVKQKLASAAMKGVQGFAQGQGAIDSLQGALGNFNQDMANTIKAMMAGGVLNATGEIAVGALGLTDALGSDVTGITQNYFGITPNPASTVTMRGPQLRRHSFSWTFAPRSQDESNQLSNIYNMLRASALPGVSDDKFFLKYPSVVFPRFEPNSEALYDFKPCVITALNINHSGSGRPSFFYDSMKPTVFVLSIELKEIELKVNGDANIGDDLLANSGIVQVNNPSAPNQLNSDDTNVLGSPMNWTAFGQQSNSALFPFG